MSVLYIAVPVALSLGAVALGACLWAIRSGQFEDLETPSIRILFDDPPQAKSAGNEGSKSART